MFGVLLHRAVRDEVHRLGRPHAAAVNAILSGQQQKPVQPDAPKSSDSDDSSAPVHSEAAGGEDAHETPPAASLIDQLQSMPGDSEWQYSYQQAVFGQLGSYAMNMQTFKLPSATVRKLVRRLTVGNNLPKEMHAILLNMASSGQK